MTFQTTNTDAWREAWQKYLPWQDAAQFHAWCEAASIPNDCHRLDAALALWTGCQNGASLQEWEVLGQVKTREGIRPILKRKAYRPFLLPQWLIAAGAEGWEHRCSHALDCREGKSAIAHKRAMSREEGIEYDRAVRS